MLINFLDIDAIRSGEIKIDEPTFQQLRAAITKLGPFQAEGTIGLDACGFQMEVRVLAKRACAVKITNK